MDNEYEPLKFNESFAVSSCGSHGYILDKASTMPLLSHEDTLILAMYWRDHQDEGALQRLFWDQALTAAKVSWDFKKKRYDLDIDELMSAAFLKTIELINGWNPEHKTPMALGNYIKTYLPRSLSGDIISFDPDRDIKRNGAQKMRMVQRALVKTVGHDITGRINPDDIDKFKDIANQHHLSLTDTFAIYKNSFARRVSLDTPEIERSHNKDIYYNPDDEGWPEEYPVARIEKIMDESQTEAVESIGTGELIQAMLDAIPDAVKSRNESGDPDINVRNMDMFVNFYLKDTAQESLESIGRKYGVSKERVRQSALMVFKMLQKDMHNRYPDTVTPTL